MQKIYTSLACPYCQGKNGDNITCRQANEYEKDENEERTIINIKKTYICHCEDCKKDYHVDYGHAKLVRYYPFIYSANDDIKLYVDYESEFDRSYRIVEVHGVPMITMEDDKEPIILEKNLEEELIDNHESARKYVYNTWMSRHR